ncbi:FtsX-like permease family protein [Streptomyces sp. C11-1]|uniref:FtsX-like permease family protein n=1 Tax=Streptomyces durocortorensis TaxID=2811104 RepID=A0ABY9VVP8_9ACTN|nr:FtsX-like permease family protein [Streptomyces durocortorensis]WNF28016.1 FtsX-like permease family protein [Streptomyces durocortorensis]
MLGLAWETLKFRKGSFVASFVALFFGATVLMACGALMETGIRSVVPPQRLAAAPVVVTGDQSFDHDVLPERARLDASLTQRIAALPGVERALPDVSFPVSALKDDRAAPGGDGLVGHGWSSAELTGGRLADGAAPSAAGEAALDAELAGRLGARTGDELRLAVAGTAETVRVTGTVRSSTGTEQALYFTDAEAGRLLGQPDQVDSIAVLPKPGTSEGELASQVEGAVKGATAVTLTGHARGVAEFPEALQASTNLISMSAVFGGLAVMVAVFVVGSTLALLVQGRMREMAMLRAIGSMPAQIRRMVVGETLVIAVAAIALAIVPGRLAGRWMLEQLAGGGVVAPEIVYRAGFVPVIVAAGASLASAVAAAHIASRRASVASPAAALTESGLQTRWLSGSRLTWALLCFIGGAALAVVTAVVMHGTIGAATTGPAALLWAGGIALISPGLTRVLIAVLRWPLRAFTGFAGELAMNNVRARRIRVAAAVTPVMLATGLATALIYMQTSQAAASKDAAAELLGADVMVSSSTGGMQPGLVERISEVPGVAGASAYSSGTAYIIEPPTDEDEVDDPDNTELVVLGITGSSADTTLAVSPDKGSFKDLRGDTIVLPASLTSENGQAVGDTVSVLLGDGTKLPLKVVASYEARSGFETAFLPAELMLKHSTTGLVPQILVSGRDGVAPSELVSSISELGKVQPGLQVVDRVTAEASGQDSGTSAWINYLLAGTIIGYAVISLVNTLIVSSAERRREFALQRLVGATPGQILRVMTVESVLVAVSGIVLGTVVAIATLAPFGIALGGSWMPQGPAWIYFAVIGFAGVLTLGATLLPARYAMRSRPAEAVAVE